MNDGWLLLALLIYVSASNVSELSYIYTEELDCSVVVTSQCFIDEFQVNNGHIFEILIKAHQIFLWSKFIIHVE